MKPMIAAFAAAVLAAAAPQPAFAYRAGPLVHMLEPSGQRAATRLTAVNNEQKPVTLEVQTFRVSIDAQGKTTRTPEDNDLLIFPPQTVIQPGREQAFSIRYTGPANLNGSSVYAVLVTQVPVDLQSNQANSRVSTQLAMGLNYLAYVFVNPRGGRPALEIARPSRGPDGALAVEVVNNGNAVALMRDADWRVTDAAGTARSLDVAKLDMGDVGALLPGSKRTVRIPRDAVAGLTGDVSIAVSLP